MNAHRKLIRRTALAATAAVAALVLAACGGEGGHDMGSMGDSGSSPSAPASTGTHNAADVSFAEEMIQHHRQAVEMAELAETRAGADATKKLAAKIKAAQDPEIRTMSGWLTSWGEEVPADMSGMGHDMASAMPGMMSREDMHRLDEAQGADFDTMFAEMMIEHHQGAVEMARTERADGAYGPAKKLADDVIKTQTAEIDEMRKMLGTS
ncbi:DUF305 domain-containing protein [Streptomyces griseus]|uniref:DUF305 domain-containing protein n=1 Tax=Streptomyces griseus TaxID=1911 RepID=UPI000840331D|nr:DUF305 domain-containing protein [Streptomyces griseus]